MPRSIKGETSERRGTKARLMDAGEQLFSRHGLEAVTIRQINRTAGQRNTSSLLYHFGSKEGLIEAIFIDRFAGINARRHAMLDLITASRSETDIPALARAAVMPFFEHMQEKKGGTDFIRFFALLYSDPKIRISNDIWREHTSAARRLAGMAMKHMTPMPPEAATQRVGLVATSVFHWLANWKQMTRGEVRLTEEDYATLTAPPESFVSTIIDLIVAIVKAPYSGATLEKKPVPERL
ncbi:MAG: TetR/AcrR family transcriptional regulator [Alphaproteobacteria bacterium]|nr:TetR/AcrR family transcriptional regulator [Alphaproteobacteria bacterium]